MKKVNYISAAFESWWNWIVGGVFEVIGVLLFFRPDLSQVINWIGFINFLPPIAWGIIGATVWIIGFAFNVRRQLNNYDNESKQKTISSKTKIGNSYSAGRDITTITYLSPQSDIEKPEPELFKKSHSLLDFNAENTLFARFVNKGNKKTGNIGMAFYSVKIVNISNEPYTVKDVILRYELDGKKYSVISNVLLTGIVFSPRVNANVNAIMVEKGTDRIIVMGWNNLRTKLSLLKILKPGGVLDGSVFYILEFDDIEKARTLENVDIVVTDYSGQESIHSIDIQEDWIIHGKNASIYPRSFIVDDKGEIKYEGQKD